MMDSNVNEDFRVLMWETCKFLEEQLRAEHEAEKQLEQKVARMLSHEKDVEKGIQILNNEIAHTVHDINKHLRGLEHQQFMDNMYWSRKAWCCILFN
jgi:hypothetical protein